MLLVEIVSPEGAAFRGEAMRFRAPGVEGSFEVLTGHAPMLAATGVGQVFVTTPGGDRLAFATSAGHVEVLNNHVIMLAETAEPAGEIDVERARAAEESAAARLEAAPDAGGARGAPGRARPRPQPPPHVDGRGVTDGGGTGGPSPSPAAPPVFTIRALAVSGGRGYHGFIEFGCARGHRIGLSTPSPALQGELPD